MSLKETFALRFLASKFPLPTNSFSFFAGLANRRLLEMLLKPHLTKHTFALKFFLQNAQRLVDVAVTNADKHMNYTILVCVEAEIR